MKERVLFCPANQSLGTATLVVPTDLVRESTPCIEIDRRLQGFLALDLSETWGTHRTSSRKDTTCTGSRDEVWCSLSIVEPTPGATGHKTDTRFVSPRFRDGLAMLVHIGKLNIDTCLMLRTYVY